jgi:hypothetical protein
MQTDGQTCSIFAILLSRLRTTLLWIPSAQLNKFLYIIYVGSVVSLQCKAPSLQAASSSAAAATDIS